MTICVDQGMRATPGPGVPLHQCKAHSMGGGSKEEAILGLFCLKFKL